MKNTVALCALSMLAASSIAHAATTQVEVKVESPSFVSGVKTIELEDNVPQTITFQAAATPAFDKRCVGLGLVDADGGVPTVVQLQVTAMLDGNNRLVSAELKARKAAESRKMLVSSNGERADCPNVREFTTKMMGKLTPGTPELLFSATDGRQDANISVTVMAK